MPQLFHPDIPGAAVELEDGWRRSGWRTWDELTGEQQDAHQAAVDALAEAAETPAPAAEPAAPPRKPRKKSTKAPGAGDTTKE